MKRGVKYIQVTFDDGIYECPAYVIARKRSNYLAEDKSVEIQQYEYFRGLEDEEILLDFLPHLDWSDVKSYFEKIEDWVENSHGSQWQDEIAEHRIKIVGEINR